MLSFVPDTMFWNLQLSTNKQIMSNKCILILWRHGWSLHLHTQLKQLWNLSLKKKKSGLNGIQTHDLCDTVVYKSAMINHVYLSFSAVQIYDISYIHFAMDI